MRRAQFDGASQPVRNHCTTPSFASGAVATVRENRIINPGFELSQSTLTVRTNLATRPRMIDTSLGGYGSQTLTAVTGLSGHPDGITTAVRVSYNAGASTPGAFFLATPAISTQYALTAWVYNEGPASETIAIALQGVTSGGSQGVPPGVWTRLEWVVTTSASASTGFAARISTPANTGSFLITGVTAELHAVVPPSFYDGATAAAGDFTYTWNGTAGQSASNMRAATATYWSASSTATIWQSGTAPASGSLKCIAVQTKGGNGDGLYVTDTAVVAGTPYTMSAWIKVTAAVPNMSIAMRFKDAGGGTISDVNMDGSVSMSIGNWVRINATTTCPTGAVNLQPMIRVYASHTPTLFYVDNVMVETGSVALSYFDGSYATAGELTHSWNGAAFHSSSLQRAPAATGLVTSGSAIRASWMSIDRQRSSLPFARTLVKSNFAIGLNVEDGTFPAGVTRRTDSIWFRTSRATSVSLRYRRPSTGTVYAAQTAVAIPANKWTELRYTRDGFADPDVCLGLLVDVTMVTPGDIYDIAEHMTVEGTYTGDHMDGNRPLSRWDGTALQSTSVGYPPQLHDLAGKPIVDVTAVGTYLLDDSFGATEGRTFYTVLDVLSEVTGALSPIMQYGDTVLSDTVPNTYIQFRIDTNAVADGISNLMVRRTGGAGMFRTVNSNRHVSTWGIDNTGKIYHGLNGAAPAADTVAMSLLHQKLVVLNNDAYHNHIRTIAYRGVHDDATRIAVSRYLGNKYGCPVA